LTPDPFPYGDYAAYLNTPKVQEAIGAYVNFSDSSQEVYDSFSITGDSARSVMSIQDIRNLLQNNVTVTLWAGDADYICNWLGVETVANTINHTSYLQAGYADIETNDGVVVSLSRRCIT
jgi:carboxypeptidase C (cathepsin A)